jgi:hypothetical protein
MRLDRLITLSALSGLGALIFGAPAAMGPGASADRLVAAVPYVLDYEFFDHLYTQTLSGDAKYGEIEAYVKESGGKPRTIIKLVEKGSGNTEVYTDSPSGPNGAKVSQIQYAAPKSFMPNEKAGFAFQDQAGQPVRWRFVFAYPPSAQGSGLNDLPNDSNLTLVFRNSGTLSNAGSAVELSGKVNEVQVWKEISQPPFFVAYRGTYTAGAHVTQLHADVEKLRVGGLSALKPGAKFEIVTASGKTRRLTVQGQGDNFTIGQEADESGVSRELSVAADAQGYSVRYLKIADGSHYSTVTFTPPLRVSASAAEGNPSEFQISVDKNRKLSNGNVRFGYTAEGAHLVWKVASPSWAKGRTVVQNLTVSEQGVTIAKAR